MVRKVFLFCVVVFMIIANHIANGYALAIMWKWFVVPIFNVASLSVVQALGLVIVCSFATSSPATMIGVQDIKRKLIPTNDYFITAIRELCEQGIYVLIVVGVSYIVTLFM